MLHAVHQGEVTCKGPAQVICPIVLPWTGFSGEQVFSIGRFLCIYFAGFVARSWNKEQESIPSRTGRAGSPWNPM